MKIFRRLFLFALLGALFADCQKDKGNIPEFCDPPKNLIAQGTCESGYSGVLVIASDYVASNSTPFIFEVFPQPDTLTNNLSVRSWKNGANTRERILVSDDVLKGAPKFVVQVTINCMGKEFVSQYFAFVKRPATNPGCYIWVRQKQ